MCVPDPIPNLKVKSAFVKTFQSCLNFTMKKYMLTIMYDDEKDEIESIKETIDEAYDYPYPSDTRLIDKCIMPLYDNYPNTYDELMSISMHNGFVIGDA
tara:strand:+ start:1820 stop:2116 length:297 start_codon:yes stop_codon:yes gene_type:complete